MANSFHSWDKSTASGPGLEAYSVDRGCGSFKAPKELAWSAAGFPEGYVVVLLVFFVLFFLLFFPGAPKLVGVPLDVP